VPIGRLTPAAGGPPEDQRENDAENHAPQKEQSGCWNSDESNYDHSERDHQPGYSGASRGTGRSGEVLF
jgi:hypothetical protein